MTAIAETVAQAFSTCGLAAVGIRQMRLLGQRAWLAVEIDQAEAERRIAGRVPALTDRRLVEVLCRLPIHEAVALDVLSAPDQDVLRQAMVGVVDLDDAFVTRRVGPVVTVGAAAVIDTQFDRGLNRASNFAQFCPRLLILRDGSTRPGELELMDADFYGIGVLQLGPQGRLDLLVDPEVSLAPFGPVNWLLREQVWAAGIAARGSADLTRGRGRRDPAVVDDLIAPGARRIRRRQGER